MYLFDNTDDRLVTGTFLGQVEGLRRAHSELVRHRRTATQRYWGHIT
jgi:hypothetical protein